MNGEKVRLGGMALGNGVLVHGPRAWACAIRTADGELKVVARRKRLRASQVRNPILRGPARLAEAFSLIPQVKRALPEAELPMQRPQVLASMLASATVLQAAKRSALRPLARELLTAVLSIAPAALALRGGDLASYHGVEHKSIAAYEQDSDDAAGAAKEHDRCGSNLVAPMLVSTTAGNVAVRRAGLRGPAAEAIVGLGSVAFAVEVFAWSERHSDSALARLLRRPGHEIQRVIGTREPTPEQLEVGQAALDEILRVEGALP